jgi:hypothetical protein
MLKHRPVSRTDFEMAVQPFLGMPLTRCRRGYGSAILLDFGDLQQVDAPRPHSVGECHVMIQWSWRVEGPRSIKFGSWSSDRRMDNGLAALQGSRLAAAAIVGRIPELVLELDSKRWIHSFQTETGQPEWAFFTAPDGDWIHVVRGRLVRELWVDP